MRGEVVYLDRYKQLINFSGLRWGKITPTDIDGLIDFGNQCFVLLEYKYKDAILPRGQELAIERCIDNARIPGMAILARHNTPKDQFINAALTPVSKIYYKQQWRNEKKAVMFPR